MAGEVAEGVFWDVVGLEDVEEVGDYCLWVCGEEVFCFLFLRLVGCSVILTSASLFFFPQYSLLTEKK